MVAKNVFPAVQLSVFQETQHICLTVSTKAQQSVSWFSLIFGEQKQDHFLPQTVDWGKSSKKLTLIIGNVLGLKNNGRKVLCHRRIQRNFLGCWWDTLAQFLWSQQLCTRFWKAWILGTANLTHDLPYHKAVWKKAKVFSFTESLPNKGTVLRFCCSQGNQWSWNKTMTFIGYVICKWNLSKEVSLSMLESGMFISLLKQISIWFDLGFLGSLKQFGFLGLGKPSLMLVHQLFFSKLVWWCL